MLSWQRVLLDNISLKCLFLYVSFGCSNSLAFVRVNMLSKCYVDVDTLGIEHGLRIEFNLKEFLAMM